MGQFPSHSVQNQYRSIPPVATVGATLGSPDVRPRFLDRTVDSIASQLEFHEGPVVLSFLSPSCGLCASVKRELKARTEGLPETDIRGGQALYLCLDASDTGRWGPEIVQYGIDRVPCFVVLGAKGNKGRRRAVGKTTCVRGESCVLEGLDRLLKRVL